MMVTGRTSRWSPIAHFVDDGGALCGARPREGRWTPNTAIPVNCPKCLVAASRPRYAFAEGPVAAGDLRLTHIRRLGPDGLRRVAGAGDVRALCGKHVGWDKELVGKTPPPGQPGVCGTCVRELRSARTGLNAYA